MSNGFFLGINSASAQQNCKLESCFNKERVLMMLTREHLASHGILEMIQILEKQIDGKITENRKIQQQLDAQKQQCLLQTERIRDMETKIKSLEELETIDVGEMINLQTERIRDMRTSGNLFEALETMDEEDVIHLEWDEVEMPSYHLMNLSE